MKTEAINLKEDKGKNMRRLGEKRKGYMLLKIYNLKITRKQFLYEPNTFPTKRK